MDNLLNKQYVGSKLEEFWKKCGYKNVAELQIKTGLTNLWAYPKGRAFPSWEGLVLIAQACHTDVATLVRVIDPESNQDGHSEIPLEHRHTVKLLLELLARAPEDARQWLTGNIETFYKAYLGRRAARK